jgi:hypothetical protein
LFLWDDLWLLYEDVRWRCEGSPCEEMI